MTILLDTEQCPIPCNIMGGSLFDADLCNWGNGKGPILSINIPEWFTWGKAGERETLYDGSGVITAPLQQILEDYLKSGYETDGHNKSKEFVSWLRDYADRLERNIKN